MEHSYLLFENNNSLEWDNKIKHKLKWKNKKFIYNISVDIFTGDQIYEILLVINYIDRKYGGQRVPIIINVERCTFSDKLVYIILETICWNMICERHRKFNVTLNVKPTIASEGIVYSPLLYLNSIEKFEEKYKGDLEWKHFRKVIPKLQKGNEQYLSDLMQEIYCFSQNNGVEVESCEQLSEVLAELVGNAGEHGETECLIDIDITDDNYGIKGESTNYYGMNAVILNYSSILFHEPLRNKMKSERNFIDRYKYVIDAQKYHSQQFSEMYSEEDFYTISSFQHKISGSIRKNEVGGTGLTQLIHSLEEKAEEHMCYMLSGNRVLFFGQEYMKYDENKYLGFNKVGDYLHSKPDEEVFKTITTNLPGTAYNLSFVIKKEW